MKTIIHVNQFAIRSNKKEGTNKPVLTVKTYKSNVYAYGVEIQGPCKIVYRPDNPLSCGARVWIETESGVKLDRKPSKKKVVNLCHVWDRITTMLPRKLTKRLKK